MGKKLNYFYCNWIYEFSLGIKQYIDQETEEENVEKMVNLHFNEKTTEKEITPLQIVKGECGKISQIG